ncbi:MAG: VWA domain-containing protein [Mariprofundaceae bacterium]
MNKNHLFEQQLKTLAWPIQCYWAKYFPIKVITTEPIDVAAMDYTQVYMHPTLITFHDDVLFCILAHEWAHRMVSPKSIDAGHRIIEAVAAALHVDFELAQLISDPAIELIVDRSNCEIKLWHHRYKAGFIESFTFFADELKKTSFASADMDSEMLQFQQMMLALRIANVSTASLPAFIRHKEKDARILIDILFEDWYGCADLENKDHIGKIVRFSKAFYSVLPQELLDRRALLHQLLSKLSDLMANLADYSSSHQHGDEKHTTINIDSSNNSMTRHQDNPFDIRLTRQITDHLLKSAHQSRQITGLWQPGHSFAKLDYKRSFRCSPALIPGITTRRNTDSSRSCHLESGSKLRVCLLVDDSGSMAGEEATFARSICEGINRFAALKDMYLGLITFGSKIGIASPPERRYHRMTKALSMLDGNLGGTNLLPALQRLSQYVESDRELGHALIITDASFSDWDQCQQPISEILAQINITILLINSHIPEQILEPLKSYQYKLNVFKVDPSKPTNIAILEEIIR